MLNRILVTGAAGFIGSNFVRRLREKRPEWQVVAFDALTYAGNLENLRGLDDSPQFEFVRGDICDSEAVRAVLDTQVGAVVNFAAETHEQPVA